MKQDEMKIIDDLQAICPHDEKVITRTKIGGRLFMIGCCRLCGKLDALTVATFTNG